MQCPLTSQDTSGEGDPSDGAEFGITKQMRRKG